MVDLAPMDRSAQEALIHVLDLIPADNVLVVTDEATRGVGDSFMRAASAYGCETRLFALPESERPLKSVPDDMARSLGASTVVVNAFSGVSGEIPFRVKWIQAIENTGRIRLGHSPGINEAMMVGPMDTDYATMDNIASALIAGFAGADRIRVTTPSGTDLTLGVAGRPFISDLKATPAVAVNLPCGEIYCAPEETRVDGLLVVDGTIGDIGVAGAPLRMELAEGRIVSFESEDADLLARLDEMTAIDDQARVVGELGIGINPAAKLTGNMLEDEKAFRTGHVALGNNEDFPGGLNTSQTHIDFLFHRPTFTAHFPDGTSRVLMKDGDVVI